MDAKKDFDDLNTTPVDLELEQEQERAEELVDIVFSVQTRRDERFLAFNLVYAVDRFDYTVKLDDIIANFVQGFELEGISENNYAWQLAQGAIENRLSLDEQMIPFLKGWKLNRLGCATRLILRMALWELQKPKAIASVVINEAVELAKIFAEKDAYKFVNGLLDQFCKKNSIKVETVEEDKVKKKDYNDK